jgi:hypothetical protein
MAIEASWLPAARGRVHPPSLVMGGFRPQTTRVPGHRTARADVHLEC